MRTIKVKQGRKEGNSLPCPPPPEPSGGLTKCSQTKRK